MLTQAIAWVGLALFVYFLLTRLRTLAVLAGARRGLGEAATVRIQLSRIAVEAIITVAIVSLWATTALGHSHLDWEVGGSGSPLHLELAGAWFIVGAIGLASAVTVLLVFAGMVAFAHAVELREQFPRSATGRPRVLRLAAMNPEVVFIAQRSPLVWAWTEVRAAALGIVATLAIEAVGHESPIAGGGLGETVDELSGDFEPAGRLGRGGRALTWNDLPTLLATAPGAASVEPNKLILPPVALPIGGRALGYLIGLLGGVMSSRSETQRKMPAPRFDERASIRVALERAPGPLAEALLAGGLDGLLHQVRGRVFDNLKRQLPRQLGRQLAKAYRREGMEGAAAWMIQEIPSYPDFFEDSLHAELDRQASLSDSILSDVQRPRRR